MMVPFFTVEHAWCWAIAVHEFKTNPKGMPLAKQWAKHERPCEHADILREATRLGLCQMGMKVLVKYGRAGKAPGRTAPENERRLWDEAMDRLYTRLRAKGIVVPAVELAGDQPGNG